MTPFEAYTMYMALKNHFTSDSYDYFKYAGKTNAKYDTFIKRNDRYFYEKLAKKDDVKGLVVSALVNSTDGKIWVRDILTEDSNEVYKDWKRRVESLTYQFKKDLSKLDEDFDSNILVTDGQHPKLLRLYLQGEVSTESIVILDSLTNMFKHWNKNIEDKLIWPAIYKKCTKYKPFLTMDKEKLKKIVIDKYS